MIITPVIHEEQINLFWQIFIANLKKNVYTEFIQFLALQIL